METIQKIRLCPWISDPINVKQYFDRYHNLLDEVNGMKPHNNGHEPKKTIREFFHVPDELEVARTTPSSSKSDKKSEDKHSSSKGGKVVSLKGQLLGNQGVDISEGGVDLANVDEDDEEDLFDVDKLARECDVDLLTVEGELPSRDLSVNDKAASGRVTNWYAGEFKDGIIPEGAAEKLTVLAAQRKELEKRVTLPNYVSLRHRSMKYAKTVRLVLKDDSTPEEISLKDDTTIPCHRETIFNVRVQRPFHRRTFHVKGAAKYPAYSQEFLMLGCQKLTELRDSIACLNDVHINKNVALEKELPSQDNLEKRTNAKNLFLSGMFYIGQTFFIDMRNSSAKDYSQVIKSWATRIEDLPPMETKQMDEAKLSDLTVRLGYPYVYMHLGNCEHHIIFTDIRLMARTDIQDISRYPLNRGNPIKHIIMCCICTLFKALWIVRDHPELPSPTSHLCERCLKCFIYKGKQMRHRNIKVFPFMDEFAAIRRLKEEKNRGNDDVKKMVVRQTVGDKEGTS